METGASSKDEKGNAQAEETVSAPPKGPQWPGLPEYYEIKKITSTSTTGAVAECIDVRSGKTVIAKRLQRLFSSKDEEWREAGTDLKEIALLNKLQHPGVIRLRAPRLGQVRAILSNLLEALKTIHRKEIVHANLKPAACLLNQDCTTKLCDFAAARVIKPPCSAASASSSPAAETSGTGTDSQQQWETPLSHSCHPVNRWFTAPEILLRQKNVGGAADVWSLGCVFAELMYLVEGNAEVSECLDGMMAWNGVEGSVKVVVGPLRISGGASENRKSDQLNVIFSLIGSPSETEREALDSEEAKSYVALLEDHPPPSDLRERLAARFPASSPSAIDLLSQMLVFSSSKRISVEAALSHPFVTGEGKGKEGPPSESEPMAPSVQKNKTTAKAEEEANEKEERQQQQQQQEQEQQATPGPQPEEEPLSLPFDISRMGRRSEEGSTRLTEQQLRYCFLREVARHHPEILPSLPEAPAGIQY
uniref:Protein kinase domain-containing protein n=1 Tax=Chromera velia CCMP2878 TaxID=1169474 RepID=A0A0G4HWU7_9ALVE|eukprot:Cvel_9105.t1-p1 / transcript=Cvel_9105.t1 / gene=Cvel_9105 / organism=Chromera_velia_CCMP2878 / gene_product=Mitogen-activated protein kinase 3, putative / transcript_product=Mitogen-activated protein kinase 3, putative / location=Cvel_scaffold517:16482-23987(+) / protein_length=476 / sequence_SO=supercontig / SO=protein_coding / is_pseudo=false